MNLKVIALVITQIMVALNKPLLGCFEHEFNVPDLNELVAWFDLMSEVHEDLTLFSFRTTNKE